MAEESKSPFEGMPLCEHKIQFDCDQCKVAETEFERIAVYEDLKTGDNREEVPAVYAAMSLMFKTSDTHNMDTLFDLIEEWLPECAGDGECTCGMVSMGGTQGSEDACWKHLGTHDSIAWVDPADLKKILNLVANAVVLENEEIEAYDRLYKEAVWYDEFETWLENIPDDEDDEEIGSWIEE